MFSCLKSKSRNIENLQKIEKVDGLVYYRKVNNFKLRARIQTNLNTVYRIHVINLYEMLKFQKTFIEKLKKQKNFLSLHFVIILACNNLSNWLPFVLHAES